jgi:outer membrane protein OmpA-like peptidoglycan-associated protein
MKKFFMMLALAGVSVAGMAQNETPEVKYSVATNSFWSNWFVSADVAYGAFYSDEEKGKGFGYSPFKDFRRNLGASVAIGKWFTPGIGLRTKGTGIWGRSVQGTDVDKNAIKFFNIQEQVLFNLSNMLCGYNETRVWNFIPYAGVGFLRNCSDNINGHGISAGLLNNFRLSKHVALNIDLGFNLFDDNVFPGAEAAAADYGNSIAKSDRYFTGEVGLTFNLGKATWNKVPDVDALKALSQSQIDALNAQLSDEQAENARLKNQLANQKPVVETKTVTVKEMMTAPVSVFFNIAQSKIASKKDLQNVKELANIAKEKNAKLVVTGYADSKTGNANLNQKLSQKRAETVADELVKMGVSRDNIEVVAAGGVNDLSPISYNRRATVAIK